MRIVRAILFVLLTHYAVYWQFPKPVDLSTAVVHVTGGELRSISIAADGLSGQIDADAPGDCIAIDWTIRSRGGLTFRGIHAWTNGCLHTYLPVMR